MVTARCMPGFKYRNDFNGDQEMSIEGGFEYRF